MKTEKDHKINLISISAAGCLIVAVIMIIGTFVLGRFADRDTKAAVRNVSLLYLSELQDAENRLCPPYLMTISGIWMWQSAC